MKFLKNKDVKIIFAVVILISIIANIATFRESVSMGILMLSVCVSFLMILYEVFASKYDQISKLTDTVDMILHSDVVVAMDNNEEGDLALLETEIRKMTVKIREGEYQLQKEKIYLTDSIADISHQLRTPLTTINLLMQKLKKIDLSTEERIDYIEQIDTNLRRIDWLVASLLKISKLDAGTIEMKKERIDANELVRRAVSSSMIALEIHDQLFDTISEGRESYIGDMNWSIEAVSNIIKNCIEHTPDGGHIRVLIRENMLYTAIEISDSGTGASPKDLPHIFERFYKGENSSPTSVGIGLALSRMIIQNQNGTIKAENLPEKGMKFTIKFYKGDIDGSTEN